MSNMLMNVIKNLFSKPATRQYPFTKREPFEGTRWSIEFDKSKCVYCGACQRKCPAAAIEVDRANKTLTFNHFSCIVCGACVETCPKGAISEVKCHRTPSYTKTSETFSGTVEPKPENPEQKTEKTALKDSPDLKKSRGISGEGIEIQPA